MTESKFTDFQIIMYLHLNYRNFGLICMFYIEYISVYSKQNINSLKLISVTERLERELFVKPVYKIYSNEATNE